MEDSLPPSPVAGLWLAGAGPWLVAGHNPVTSAPAQQG